MTIRLNLLADFFDVYKQSFPRDGTIIEPLMKTIIAEVAAIYPYFSSNDIDVTAENYPKSVESAVAMRFIVLLVQDAVNFTVLGHLGSDAWRKEGAHILSEIEDAAPSDQHKAIIESREAIDTCIARQQDCNPGRVVWTSTVAAVE
jgi:hypothetical protein